MMRHVGAITITLLALRAAAAQGQAEAGQYPGGQHPPGQQGSRNISIVSPRPLAGAERLIPGPATAPNAAQANRNVNTVPQNEAIGMLGTRTADITMEQELSRPYVYVCHRFAPTGFWIISIKDPS